MRLPSPQREHHRWGRADFFDGRHKSIVLRLAEMTPSDVFYDLGCGDASLLVHVVKKARLRRAVGFENMPSRALRARRRIAKAGLEGRITIESDMYDADLGGADVIFDMLPEGDGDYESLYSGGSGIRAGTRIIKHDLPLVGFLPDRVDYPFYLMRFPLRRAETQSQWASSVLGEDGAEIRDLWHELLYYQYEKGYHRDEVTMFQALLDHRVPRRS
ncbi:MAG: hypothetical protein ABSF83_04405 [Nitrososphaerales archaeon]